MNVIAAQCRTNLDGYSMFVNQFASIPNKGDLVECYHNGNLTTLSVHSITHTLKSGKPFIIVELYLP